MRGWEEERRGGSLGWFMDEKARRLARRRKYVEIETFVMDGDFFFKYPST